MYGRPQAARAMDRVDTLWPYMLLFARTIFLMVLGCFLDGISVVVPTTSVILPMVE